MAEKNKKMTDTEYLIFLSDCKTSGIQYRDKFRDTWEEIERQIRCVPPDSWQLKEDWQTKIYIPLQSKKSEIALSYLSKMIFPKGTNFGLTGVSEDDKEDVQQLVLLISTLMRMGGFQTENEFVLTEAIDQGTAFLKLTMTGDENITKLTWRSPLNCVFDPDCGHNFSRKRFWTDLYKKDISWLMNETRNPHSLYSKDKIKSFFDDAAGEVAAVSQTNQNTSSQSQENREPTLTIRSIDGTQDITIPAKYKIVDIDEHWVMVPTSDGYDMRVTTILNSKYILRDNENELGFIPVTWCRTKPRKYDAYGRGYMENTRGLQDLINTTINLGFDSLKISSMDIIVINERAVADPASIKYKPLAIWKMKDINGVKIQRQPSSSITDILRGLTIIDQIDQDASGITRHAAGTPSLSSTGTEPNTLGEYKLQLQMVDDRFLKQGRFIEMDYYVPLITMYYKIVMNEKLFTQKMADDILGMKQVDELEIDPISKEAKVIGKKSIPKLDLKNLREKGDMSKNFVAFGVTLFTDKLEKIEKLKQALDAALSNPTLSALTKIDVLWQRLWQAAEIDDYQDFLRSIDEVKEMLGEQGAPPGAPPMAPQGMPQGAPIA